MKTHRSYDSYFLYISEERVVYSITKNVCFYFYYSPCFSLDIPLLIKPTLKTIKDDDQYVLYRKNKKRVGNVSTKMVKIKSDLCYQSPEPSFRLHT